MLVLALEEESTMQPASPIVMCPGCLIAMAAAATEALPMQLMRATFRCGKCGTETVRFFKCEDHVRPDAAPDSIGAGTPMKPSVETL